MNGSLLARESIEGCDFFIFVDKGQQNQVYLG
jgi:hypothetical protein